MNHKKQCEDLVRESKELNSPMDGAAQIDEGTYEEWLVNVTNYAKGLALPEGYVSADTFLVFDNENLVGLVNISHELNDFLLKAGGHIGYMVRPNERRKGYAKKLLKEALKYCENDLGITKVLVTCNPDNIASKKTILANGGIFESQVTTNELGIINRYWITM